jgi:hypothetical protein
MYLWIYKTTDKKLTIAVEAHLKMPSIQPAGLTSRHHCPRILPWRGLDRHPDIVTLGLQMQMIIAANVPQQIPQR